jgi:type IV secretion system protein VirD4
MQFTMPRIVTSHNRVPGTVGILLACGILVGGAFPVVAGAQPAVNEKSAPVTEATIAAQAAPASSPLPDTAPAWLKQMPEPERVIADIRGSDALNTAARQAAALNRLIDVVITLSGTADAPGGPRLTTEERNLNGRYAGAASSLLNSVYRSIDPDNKQRFDENSKRNQWNRLRDRYGNDEAFISALLQRYLPPDLQEQYLRHMRQTRQNIQALRQHIQAATGHQRTVAIQQTNSPGFLSSLSAVVKWGIGIGALVLGIWWRRGATTRRRRVNNQKAMRQFGATKDERSKNIDSVFDKRAVDVGFDLQTKQSGIKCHFFRSLSAMGAREREVLRTAYHLYNLGLFGGESNFYLVRLGLIYADGKAVITGKSKYRGSTTLNIGSISDAIKSYQGSNGLEAMINLTLHWLQANTKKNNDDPVLRKLSSRLHGDGSDLLPGAPLRYGVKGAPVEGGLILGLDEKASDTWWYYDGEGSLITVAPPGSGKTQSQVFPNLLTWTGAAVVLDVKGEIYEQTSKWRRANVGPVYKFSPLDPATSHGYNPLAQVRADRDYLWEDARFLADMMIVPSGATDPFWESRARDVLTAAIARVCLEEDVAKRSMTDVLDILHGVGWDSFVTYLEARVEFPSMKRAGHSLANMEAKTRDGVLQSALSSMSAWDGERIARATRKSDWSPLDLRGGKNPTIYICLKPNEVDSYISLLRVFIAQHIRSLTSTKVPSHGVHPILFILDELPRLRHMPPIEEALEIGRQYGIKLWLFAQSLGQLSNAYPNAEGMIGGCAIRMFMNPSLHDETAQKVSDDIGFQESVLDGTRVKVVEPTVLAGPEYKDLVVVMAANAKAARLRKYFTFEDEQLTARMGSL